MRLKIMIQKNKKNYLRPIEPFSDRLHRRAVEDVGRLTGESSLRLLRPKHLRHSETCHYDLTRKRHTTRHQLTAYKLEFFRQVSPSNIQSSIISVDPHIRNCASNVNRASVRLTDEHRLQRHSSLLRMRSLNIMDDVTFEINRTAIYDIFEFIEFLKD